MCGGDASLSAALRQECLTNDTATTPVQSQCYDFFRTCRFEKSRKNDHLNCLFLLLLLLLLLFFLFVKQCGRQFCSFHVPFTKVTADATAQCNGCFGARRLRRSAVSLRTRDARLRYGTVENSMDYYLRGRKRKKSRSRVHTHDDTKIMCDNDTQLRQSRAEAAAWKRQFEIVFELYVIYCFVAFVCNNALSLRINMDVLFFFFFCVCSFSQNNKATPS